MKRVLYVTNIQVPYRVRFFNQLAQDCDLTVLYESKGSEKRNTTWAKSERSSHRVKYLRFRWDALGMIKEVLAGYDTIILGCYNSPIQMLANLVMRLLGIPYIINLDGETFLEGNNFKTRMKRFFLSGAEMYLVAGKKAANTLKTAVGTKPVFSYPFTSLSGAEVKQHREAGKKEVRSGTILVVGQNYAYKGMDVALEAARRTPFLQYKFVGMGGRTEQFQKEHEIPDNVQIIPFLQKEDLEKEYQTCAMLVLPSRQECWGLVINEAASFGMPIVSTWGSGAAVEFLADAYPQYLAKPADAESLCQCIGDLHSAADKAAYSDYLLEKSREYTLEAMVEAHLLALDEE